MDFSHFYTSACTVMVVRMRTNLLMSAITPRPSHLWIKGNPSLEGIIFRHGLAKEKLQEECSQAIRLKIAAKLEDWKMVGRYLNIPSEKLTAIERENYTESQRKIAMLDTWYKREGEGASYSRLADALYQHGRRDLIELLCKLIPPNESPEEPSNHSMNAEVSTYRTAFSSGKITPQSYELGL